MFRPSCCAKRTIETNLYVRRHLSRSVSAGLNPFIPALWRPFGLSQKHHVGYQKRQNLTVAPDALTEPPKIIPKLAITFTCKACDHRSSHEMTKQAYTKGTVLIQCPSCQNRHLIADNLKIFSDKNINIEDILREQGQSITKGNATQGDIEIMHKNES